MLRRDEAEAAIDLWRAQEIRLQFAEGIPHLDNGAERSAGGVGAKVEGDGIKDIAEHARESDQHDASSGRKVDTLIRQPCAEILAETRRFQTGQREMVAVAEGIDVPAIATESAHVERIEFIEIEGKHEDSVTETVLLRLQPMMHHGAFVET